MIANNRGTFADGVTCDDMLALGLWIIEQCDKKKRKRELEDELLELEAGGGLDIDDEEEWVVG